MVSLDRLIDGLKIFGRSGVEVLAAGAHERGEFVR
jgi:hypothetical protein